MEESLGFEYRCIFTPLDGQRWDFTIKHWEPKPGTREIARWLMYGRPEQRVLDEICDVICSLTEGNIVNRLGVQTVLFDGGAG